MNYLTPPKWCPNAIATQQGWRHPKTKELLVSLRGLQDMLNVSKEQIEPVEDPIEEKVILELKPIEIETQEEITLKSESVEVVVSSVPLESCETASITIELDKSSASIETPVKRSRGRPKLIK